MSRALHRSAPQGIEAPEFLVGLGRTIGVGANGSVSNLSPFPSGVVRLRHELRAFAPDVVHVHEPGGWLIASDAVTFREAPVVGTFHAYSTKALPNWIGVAAGARRAFNQLHARIAVSEAAAWTGRRWFGGDYDVIPNGVDLTAPPSGPKPPSDEFRILFVGRPEERKGLPVLLAAFQALVEHVPARLTLIGADQSDLSRYLPDPDAEAGIDALGRVSQDELWQRMHASDVLCAPSLAGESFGMVLTEAFATATAVVASEIAGYTDVVTDGYDGVLVPPADPQRLAEELQSLSLAPQRLARMGRQARSSAERYAWPRVAEKVEEVYQRVQTSPAPADRLERGMRRSGLLPIDGSRPSPAMRLPSLDPQPAGGAPRHRVARRVGLGIAGLVGAGLTFIAAQRIGVDQVVENVVRSDLTWVLVATALMVASLFLRASSWYAIARSALPRSPLRRRDVTSATMVGVLMSATLPARLGEPARATVLARRTGRMRETFPVLLGTLVSQSVLNIFALVLLGALIVSSTSLFHSSSEQLFLVSLAPLALLLAVVFAPFLVRQNGPRTGRESRRRRARRAAQGAHRPARLPRPARRRSR